MRVQLIGTAEGRSIDVREDDGEVTEKAKAKEGGSALMDMANLWTGGLRFSYRVQIIAKCLMTAQNVENKVLL